ncbi:MAG: PQQ-like beta-propeller repeat protein [Planctomycetaceae bacterium]|nr:PQQ-like beta-propeller repeat protein [Planctomycetaceae bacterium]
MAHRFIFAAVVALSLIGSPVKGEDWPQFLGPLRNGISQEKNLLDAWPDGGLPEVWRVDGGIGMSGVVVAGGRLVTLWQDDDHQQVVALAADTGKRLWQTPIAPAFRNSMGNGPRATPTIDGPHVFAYTGEGVLAAVQLADGKLVWKREVLDDLDANQADYGMACSPLVIGDLVVVATGAPGASLMAFDKTTGAVKWQSGNDSAGYSSPALLDLAGTKQLVAFTGESAIGLVPETGEPLWRYPFKTDYDCNVITPLVIDNKVFISAGENRGSVLLELVKGPDGVKPREFWSSLGNMSSLRAEWQTPLLVDGCLYAFDNVGSAGPVTNLVCLDAATGKQLWMQRRFGKGNATYADGKLFIATMVGEIVIARADPHGYVELGREAIMGGSRQAPTIVDGRLYLRDNREVMCLNVRRK